MRLTLRTMLAYMDGILEPEDAQDLGKKIEESEFATGLMHRIRDVTRRLRLAAPDMSDHGPGLDPNTVAEYLDNTLHDSRVADFEKVCLDSDIHLAEVASCHQILTLVLGEPAEIDPAARQRMYGLIDQKLAESVPADPAAPPVSGDGQSSDRQSGDRQSGTEPAGAEPSGGDPIAAPPVVSAASADSDIGQPEVAASPRSRRKRVVPDYLREPRRHRHFLPAVVVLALALCVTVVVLNTLGQFEPGTFLGDLWRGSPNSEVAVGPQSDVPPPPAEKPTDKPSNGETPTAPATNPPDVKSPDTEVPGGAAPDASGSTPVTPLPDVSAPEMPPSPNGELPGETPAGAAPGESTAPTTVGPVEPPSSAIVGPNAVATAEPLHTAASGVTPGQTPASPVTAKPPVPPKEVAALVSGDQVLLRHDPATSVWERVSVQDRLLAGHVAVSLPTFRPKVMLTAGSTVQLIDAAQVELLAGDQQTSGGVKVDYGRLVLTPQAAAPTHLRLQVGSHSGVLTFPDAESIAAVDVRRIRTPGTNPETEPAAAVASLYVKSGQVLWQDDGAGKLAGQAPLVVEPGNCLILDAQPLQAPIAAPEFPKWGLSDTASPLDRRASSVIEPAIQVGRPVSLGLAELLDHRLQEVQWLAIRCLGQIGNFDPMVAALNDPNRKAAWPAWPLFVEQLKTSLAYGPETAAQVRRALEKQHGQYAADSYRMLWGYTLEGFRSGQAEDLVTHYLDHEILALRVLSFLNLESMTGLKLYYDPTLSAAKRKQAIRSWQERIASGDLWAKLADRERETSGGVSPAAPPAEVQP